MKGFVEETIWVIVLVIAVIIISLFIILQQGMRGAEVRKTVEERLMSEQGTTSIFSLFNNQLLFVDKTYLETAIDAVLQGEHMKKEKSQVYYGNAVGSINVTEIIPPLFDNYLKGRWRVEVTTPDGEYTYGKQELGDTVYSYKSMIPVPEERIGEIAFYIS
jgi:hypothetical protein